ncbi:hypothetical protein A3I28_00310 [Candidatus Giovannonibacteria bacterium RIFCSPLOWO2_02_FULL_43_37]|uniref:Uncharacterized protein n=2 Tax=Candidatus Giovannoniibacteriota TaxID=1752738 RepID=A0A1F5XWG4_9BACT|nr:MAG: hypothetical protein A2652_01040 [Candidatus Giovannonibacteria bacterium RIFCSPHIGHO2_01_FULL_43_140]OGF69736.1 MAG: hypothetical protein A3C76_03290 [Candidatus Giovannonibacteria bacterium RIFCSPHIGHO2_02_FULL_44_51]OGF86097.1 MAG: hypothetical protein A3I28_00310 [Candidatus Giovannonibacteria bacterium RIFCSPLOWO2_02_FULL_43_37]OGF92287.1 MAG: hypothetical protein A3H05_02935 [Candidatus Giovannonibacteria bacterium RIFCSPLOWO2_12_FULL_43_26]
MQKVLYSKLELKIGSANKSKRKEGVTMSERDYSVQPFSVADSEGWKVLMQKNSDGGWPMINSYVSRWANLMEQRMALGERLENIAEITSQEADDDKVLNMIYTQAVYILSRVWKYKEEFRRWQASRS